MYEKEWYIMKILYYDCFAGISGDMNLAAMIDLGVDEKYLKNELAKLGLNEYSINVSQDSRHSISGTRVDVVDHSVKEEGHSHDGHHDHGAHEGPNHDH